MLQDHLSEKALALHLQRVVAGFVGSAFGAGQFYDSEGRPGPGVTSKLQNEHRDEDRDGIVGLRQPRPAGARVRRRGGAAGARDPGRGRGCGRRLRAPGRRGLAPLRRRRRSRHGASTARSPRRSSPPSQASRRRRGLPGLRHSLLPVVAAERKLPARWSAQRKAGRESGPVQPRPAGAVPRRGSAMRADRQGRGTPDGQAAARGPRRVAPGADRAGPPPAQPDPARAHALGVEPSRRPALPARPSALG